MSKIMKITQAYLAKFTKSFGFQRIQKELVHCANTLLAGNTMGARRRRAEFLLMIKEVHKIVKAQAERHEDAKAFEEVTEAAKTSLKAVEELAAKVKAEAELQAKNELNSTSEDESPDKSDKTS